MRHLLVLCSLALALSPLTAASLEAQSSVASQAPSPRAACQLKMLAAEGFHPHPRDSIASEKLLTRVLTGVDSRTGMPDHDDARVQLLEVRIDGVTPGLVLERAFVLRPQAGDQSAFAAEGERLDRDVRAQLRETALRCPS